MAWSGGTYTKGNAATGGWAGDAAGGIGIEAGRHDTQDNDFQNGINNCLTKDGQNTPTANLPMDGYKHTGVGSATANDQYTAWAQLRNGTPVYIDTTNSRLGVGTSSPTQKLSVEGNVTVGSPTVVGNYGVTIATGGASTTKLTKYSAGTGEIRHQGGNFQVVVEDAANFSVYTSNTQRLTIDSSGNIAAVGQVQFSDGTVSAPGIAFSGDTNTGLYRIGTDVLGIATAGVEAARVTAGGVVAVNDTATALYRLRVRASSSTGLVSAARLATDYSGDVGNPVLVVEKFDTNNTASQIFVRFNQGLGATPTGSGQIVANGANSAAFASYSDQSLKENIVPLGDELANIMALEPCEFDYKDGSGHQIGFIAQDVQEVYPDLVSADEKGLLMLVGLSKNEARMIRAIQQLAAKVEALEAQLEAQLAG